MALSADDLSEIETMLASAPSVSAAAAALRRHFPSLSLTRCDAGDVTEAPFATWGAVELHLVDSIDHCARLTTDPAAATGLVLAWRGGVA